MSMELKQHIFIIPNGQIDTFIKNYFQQTNEIYLNYNFLEIDHLIEIDGIDDFTLCYKIYQRLKQIPSLKKYISIDYIKQLLKLLNNIQAQEISIKDKIFLDNDIQTILTAIQDVKTKYYHLHKKVNKIQDFSAYTIVDGYYSFEQSFIINKMLNKNAKKISLFNEKPLLQQQLVVSNSFQQIQEVVQKILDKNNYDNSIIVCFDDNTKQSLFRSLLANNIPIYNQINYKSKEKIAFIKTIVDLYKNFNDQQLIYNLFIKYNYLDFSQEVVCKLKKYYFKFNTLLANFNHLNFHKNTYNLIDKKEFNEYLEIENSCNSYFKLIQETIEGFNSLNFEEYLQIFFFEDDDFNLIQLIKKYYLFNKNNDSNFLNDLFYNQLELISNNYIFNQNGVKITSNFSFISNNYDYYFLDMVSEYFNRINNFGDIFNFKHNPDFLNTLNHATFFEIFNYEDSIKRYLLSKVNYMAFSPNMYFDIATTPLNLCIKCDFSMFKSQSKQIFKRNFKINSNTLMKKIFKDNQFDTSVSMLETFYQNPFRFYLRYIIKINQLSEEGYNPALKGTILHLIAEKSVLEFNKKIYLALLNKNINLYKSLISERDYFIDNLFENIVKELKIYFLDKYNEFKHEEVNLKIMINNLKVLFANLDKHQFLSYLENVETEKTFNYSFKNTFDQIINIKGKIDRIDKIMIDNQEYFILFDYKSSKHDFSIGQMCKGNLQLVTYLLANSSKLYNLLGAYYFNVNKPNEKLNGINLITLNLKHQTKLKNQDLINKFNDINEIFDEDCLIDKQTRKRYYTDLVKAIEPLNLLNKHTNLEFAIINCLLDYTKYIYEQFLNQLLIGDIYINNNDTYFNYQYLFLDGIGGENDEE